MPNHSALLVQPRSLHPSFFHSIERLVSRASTGRWLVLGALLLGACKGADELLLPSEGAPASIEVVRGDGQSGRVGEPLAAPVVVVVVDTRNRPVEGATVTFELTSPAPGAQIAPATAITDANGEASAQLLLGTTVGRQAGEARLQMAGRTLAPSASFAATAVSENANSLAAVSGQDQTGQVNAPLDELLVVQVTDNFGNPIGGVPISWEAQGGGSVSEGLVTTDEEGRASVARILGPAAGPQTTLASAEGLAGSPVTFLHTALAGNASRLAIVSGNNQTGQIGSVLPAELVVRLIDGEGNGVPNTAVAWVVATGGGSVTPSSSNTDADGRASARWTLGGTPATGRLDAVVSGVGVASFTATATAGAPSALAIITQPAASARNGIRLERQPAVQLRDAAGNPVPRGGIQVSAALGTGTGSLTGTRQRITDGSGRATFTDLAITGPAGQYSLVFSSAGYASVISSRIDLSAIPTVTTITSDVPDPTAPGSPFTVGFRVSSDGPTPGGTVTVTDGVDGCSGILSGGSGSCALALTTSGERTLRATYPGGPGLGSSADTEIHRVQAPPPQNQPPVANFDSHCQALACQFTDRSSDRDGSLVTRSWSFGDGSPGSSETNPKHTFPSSGTYTVTLTVTDNGGGTGVFSEAVTVNAPPPPQNKAPHAEFEVHCTNLDCSFTDKSKDDDGSVTGWHWDFGDGQVSAEQNPAHSYTTAGKYQVTLTVTDNGGASASRSHDVDANAPPPPPNQPPTAQDDGPFSTQEDTPLHGGGLLANDQDPEGGSLQAELAGDASHGHVAVHADGSFDYTPDANYSGGDSFTYRAVDDHGASSNAATVAITVSAVDDAPVANDDGGFVTTQDTPLTISAADLLANDTDAEGDALAVSGVSDPQNGSVILGGDGSVTFTPTAGYTGTGGFTYTAGDGSLSSNPATVSITVNPTSPPSP